MDDDLFVEARLDADRSICISTLSPNLLSGEDATELGGGAGYYIYEVDQRPLLGGIKVLAKAASSEAALRLAEVCSAHPADPPAA